MLRGQCTVHSSVTYFEQMLCRGLWVDFEIVYTVFSALIALSNALGSTYFLLIGATIFAKLCSKILKSQKIHGKVCARDFI